MCSVVPTQTRPSIPNAVVGTLIFLATEAMFFAGLISACIILRAGSMVWPAADQPRLPSAIAFGNMLILLASGWFMWQAVAAGRAGRRAELERRLAMAAVLGFVFLAVQGGEWIQLLHFGLHHGSEVYGGVFYTLIGAHGLHVTAGLILLLVALRRSHRRRTADIGLVEACRLYWTFVVAVWPLLYGLVY